ncbi:MAG: HAD family hydrolase [Thermoplasmata archaeon]
MTPRALPPAPPSTAFFSGPPPRGADADRSGWLAGDEFEWILFDLEGTLIDERDPARWSEAAGPVGLPSEPESLAHFYAEVAEATDAAGGAVGTPEFWQRVFGRVGGAPPDPARVGRFLDRLAEEPAPVRAFSDVRWCLKELARCRISVGVLANHPSEAALGDLLARAGLSGRFQFLLASGSEGVAKPDPEIFRRALGRIRRPADRVAYVGDRRHEDVRCARAAGLAAFWLNRPGTGFGPEPAELTSLTELPGAIGAGARVK